MDYVISSSVHQLYKMLRSCGLCQASCAKCCRLLNLEVHQQAVHVVEIWFSQLEALHVVEVQAV